MPFDIALWAALIKILLAIGFIMLAVPMLVWLERKLIADFQARVGPSRVGPFGLLQSFVDGIKLVAKESIVPAQVDHLLYYAGPVIVMIPALAVAAVVPFGGPITIGGEFDLFGQTIRIPTHTHRLVIADLPVGILFVLALTSLSVYGIVLSGWASSSKYSLLGGLRSAAQMVSYELPMGLSLVAGLMIASYASPQGFFSLSLSQLVDAQSGWFWNWTAFNWRFLVIPGFLAMVTFYICGLAETNRAPFDLPEAETELVGGYHTEYGGLKWAMFFLGEYAAMLNVAAVTATVFLGGWHAPYPDTLLFPVGSIGSMLQGMFWFGLKIYGIIILYMWIRATLPRLRYDRLMSFTWKGLLPATLGNVLLIGVILTAAYGEKPPAVLTRNPDAPVVLEQQQGPGLSPHAPSLAAPPAGAPGGDDEAPAGGGTAPASPGAPGAGSAPNSGTAPEGGTAAPESGSAPAPAGDAGGPPPPPTGTPTETTPPTQGGR